MYSKKRGFVYIAIGTILFIIGLIFIYNISISIGVVFVAFGGAFILPGFFVITSKDEAIEKTTEKEIQRINPLCGILIQENGVYNIVTASQRCEDEDLIKEAEACDISNGDTFKFRGKSYAKKDNKYYLISEKKPFVGETYNKKSDVLSKLKTFVPEFEGDLPLGAKSCLEILLNNFQRNLKDSRTLTEKELYTITMNLCYSLLVSGEFHFYAGTLNPYSEALALFKVLKGCALWLIAYKFMTEEQYKNLCDNLDNDISQVG